MANINREFLEEVDYDGPEYLVRFALGLPLDMDEMQYWTSTRWIEVHARAREAWVAWVSEPDPVVEMDWATRIARICWTKPWQAVWEYADLDWRTLQWLDRLIKDDEKEEMSEDGWHYMPEREEDDDDDQGDAEGVLAGLRSARMA